jgi:hypothetical protein
MQIAEKTVLITKHRSKLAVGACGLGIAWVASEVGFKCRSRSDRLRSPRNPHLVACKQIAYLGAILPKIV